MSNPTLRVVDIVEGTSVDGPGLRTSVYLAGCAHRCPECHNPQTWDFNAGSDMSIDEIMHRIDLADLNVTLTGGDPVYQAAALLPLLQRLRNDGRTVWLYTGFTFEQIAAHPVYSAILPYLEVMVDGPFMIDLRDTDLIFRGSSNQRIINVGRTLASHSTTPILWESDF